MESLVYGQFADGLNRFTAVIKQKLTDLAAQGDVIER
jgi:hypothetical protein